MNHGKQPVGKAVCKPRHASVHSSKHALVALMQHSQSVSLSSHVHVTVVVLHDDAVHSSGQCTSMELRLTGNSAVLEWTW